MIGVLLRDARLNVPVLLKIVLSAAYFPLIWKHGTGDAYPACARLSFWPIIGVSCQSLLGVGNVEAQQWAACGYTMEYIALRNRMIGSLVHQRAKKQINT